METLWHLIVVFSTIAAYFIPAIIAAKRRHRNFMPITLTTMLLGWTGIVWIVCLIWATSSNIHREDMSYV